MTDEEIKAAESEFHRQRRMFYINFDDRLILAPRNIPLSHQEWMGKEWESLVRGYVDSTGIYFYLGKEHRGGRSVKIVARRHLPTIFRVLGVRDMIHIGVRKGAVGERWEPLETFQTYSDFVDHYNQDELARVYGR